MPEAKKEEEKTVDIDTSGPDVDINLPEEKDPKEVEVKDEKVETSNEKQETETKVEEKPVEEKQETKVDEKKEELEQYSEGVQKRIAKLTKKWREAERQKEAALDYAKGVQHEHSELKTKFSNFLLCFNFSIDIACFPCLRKFRFSGFYSRYYFAF